MNPKKVYIKNHAGGAGKWIYEGYQKAWESLDYETRLYDSLQEIDLGEDSYYLMALDGDVQTPEDLEKVKSSYKTFLYAQPNEFPRPWGTHPNFKCQCPLEFIDKLNELSNVSLWTFGNTFEYHTKWKEPHSIPLAFDTFSYKKNIVPELNLDVCYVGGWANNGFDEKRQILTAYLNEFRDSKLACGLFVNRDLTHQQENDVLYNSKVALNLHDVYQRTLGTDTNERTFKSLGTVGLLVSDDIECLKEFNFAVVRENDPQRYLMAVEKYVFDTLESDLEEIKKHNLNEVLTNHTYVSRVKSLLEL
tara:strand:+ start:381 stop:1295 length:915 start_codon:yes stop_codon:yes gene_type:complete